MNNKTMKTGIVFVFVACTALLAGCGGEPESETQSEPGMETAQMETPKVIAIAALEAIADGDFKKIEPYCAEWTAPWFLQVCERRNLRDRDEEAILQATRIVRLLKAGEATIIGEWEKWDEREWEHMKEVSGETFDGWNTLNCEWSLVVVAGRNAPPSDYDNEDKLLVSFGGHPLTHKSDGSWNLEEIPRFSTHSWDDNNSK